MKCIPCLRDFHETCRGNCDCEHKPTAEESTEQPTQPDEQTTERSEVREPPTPRDSLSLLGELYGVDVSSYRSGTGVPNSGESSESASSGEDTEPIPVARRQRRTKPDAALKDQQSTGRKRAAKYFPLRYGEACEWRSKSRCGGGLYPIRGCTDGTQQARHHGPDKNTLNNEPGNVHRICHNCHNRWHANNDPDYDSNNPVQGD